MLICKLYNRFRTIKVFKDWSQGMQKFDVSNHPRPDFIRDHWESLNGEWDFSFDTDIFDYKIQVPYVYQSKMSGIGITKDHEVIWYRKNFHISSDKINGKRLLLKFGAVDYEAEVYINGSLAGNHRGGNTSFTLDITPFIQIGDNELKVMVRDGLETDKPRGKQSWTGEPFGCWYTATSGIWQNVWLEYTGETYIKRIKITPKLNDNLAVCEVFISDNQACSVSIDVTADSVMMKQQYDLGSISFPCKNGYGKCVIAFPDMDFTRDRLIWSLENPNLIFVEARLECDHQLNDKVITYFGMRSTEFRNKVFYLNGHMCMQRLVLDQGYWSDSLLTPPSEEAIIEDIRLTKEMGFNGVRKHQKIEDPRYYYWADRMGLLVWGELPSSYMFTDTAVKNSVNEMIEFVERDYNHPSIITWVPVNESWGVRNIRTDLQQQAFSNMMIYLIKSLDPIRSVSGNDGWEQTTNTDIMTMHDYALMPNTIHRYDNINTIIEGAAEGRPTLADLQEYRNQPVMMTEYGGVAFADGADGWGYYNNVKSEEEFIGRIEPITDFLIKSDKFAGFCYTQLTDVMQEKNGLLYADRTPKVSLERLKQIFGRRYFE